jgi:CBS domain-containing protein
MAPETQAHISMSSSRAPSRSATAEGELAALLGPGDSFDSRAMMQGSGARSFVAREETLCYLMPRDLVLALIQKNAALRLVFLSRHLPQARRAGARRRRKPFRHADARAHQRSVPASGRVHHRRRTIETAGHRMREIDSNALYVRDGDKVGIITGMNLSKAVVLRRMPISDPVRAVTHFDLVSIDADDFVFSALISMTKHNKRRLAVTENGKFIGILEDIDLLSFLAGNSQLVAGRIDRASSVADLTVAAADIAGQVRMLRRQGVKAEVVAEIISDLNRRLLAKLFQFLAPPDLRAKSCLIVMGSEGRGEQTVRTDQDNGLILSEPVDEAVLDEFRVAFTDALEKFGFPPCPGNVMVRNPLWSKPLSEYLADFHRWIALPDADSHMNVAIFYDADAVAGKVTLLDEAKRALISKVQGERVYLAHFAKAIEAFPTPIGFFNNLITSAGAGDAVDLKKGGIFPIVHGVRSLAIERGITETSTAGRISKLIEIGALKPEFGRELTQALQFLISLRLDSQLAETGGLMKPAALSSMERDLLRDSFQVVKQFREIVRRHFNLSMFG